MVKILIAEDDSISRRILEKFLERWGYEVTSVADGTDAWQALGADEAPRLAILDWMMPGMDGLSLCRAIRSRGHEPYVYVLLLTAKDQPRDIVEGMEAGADDYLTKPFDAHELKARLRAGLRILELEEKLIQARESLRQQATHDPLTGIWNRAAIVDILKRELERARREGTPLGVIMMDLDHFKCVNDTCGHLAGDEVLREMTRRMQAAIRSYDSVGRYGGEEFLIVVPGTDAASTYHQAERLRLAVRGEVTLEPGRVVPVTVSVGAVSTVDLNESDCDALLRVADAALYQAKNAGRDRAEMALAAEVTKS